jgi:hypothetical protein
MGAASEEAAGPGCIRTLVGGYRSCAGEAIVPLVELDAEADRRKGPGGPGPFRSRPQISSRSP